MHPPPNVQLQQGLSQPIVPPQQGLSQQHHGQFQQQQPSQVQENENARTSMPPPPIPQPQQRPAFPAQATHAKGLFDFGFDEIIQYISFPFNTLTFASVHQAESIAMSVRVGLYGEAERQFLIQQMQPEKASRVKFCSQCPEWFWGNEYQRCVQCIVEDFEKKWKLRTVLLWTQLYKEWLEKISISGITTPKKATLVMELNSRLVWLQQRQEFIRFESLRVAREAELRHEESCLCQGISVWEETKGPMIGLMVHMDSPKGVTIEDGPAENVAADDAVADEAASEEEVSEYGDSEDEESEGGESED